MFYIYTVHFVDLFLCVSNVNKKNGNHKEQRAISTYLINGEIFLAYVNMNQELMISELKMKLNEN